MEKRINFFLKINSITLGSVFILILMGGIVRAMGAGMGCPDWPKCFGSYVPPINSERLPENYQDIYREQRLLKNEYIAKIIDNLGFRDLSDTIRNDPKIFTEQEFDASKAWIEYINRLVGVLIGLLMFLNMIFSFSFRKKSIWIPFIGVMIFVLTGFQGWVGSLVVSTNLFHGFITFHMLLAMLIVAMLIWMNVKTRFLPTVSHNTLFVVSTLTMILVISQVILGTEVRGVIDDLLNATINRDNWSTRLTTVFYVHRSHSWLILVGAIVLFYFAMKLEKKWLLKTTVQLIFLIFITMLVGVGMVKFDFPFWMQPLHLILGVSIFSMLFYLTLRLRSAM